MRRFCSTLLTVSLLAGCSGGGATSSSLVPQTHPSGTPSASPIKPADATATVSIVLPVRTASSTGRLTRFISPAAGSIAISVYSVDGVVQSGAPRQIVSLASSGPTCSSSGGATTCTASITIPSGSDVFSVASYASTNGTGTLLGSGHSVPQTIYANSANRVTLAVSGIIANLYVFPGISHFVPGTPATGLIFVIPLDPSGNPIVNPGAYASPITLQSFEPRLKLDLNGGAQVSTVSIASPNDVVTMHYDGTGSVGVASFNATTAASPPQVPAAPTGGFGIAIAPTFAPITLAAPSGPFANGAAYLFDNLAGNETATIAIATGGPAVTVSSVSPFVASVSPSSGTGPFTLTRVGPGSTLVKVTNASGATATIPVSTQANTGVQAVVSPQVISTLSGNTINMGYSGVTSIALVGGTSIYTPNNTCPAANITLSGSSSQYTIHDISPTPFTCTLWFTDPGGASLTPLTTQILTINGYSAPVPSPAIMNYSATGSANTQTSTISGGLAPYNIDSSPSTFTVSQGPTTVNAFWLGGNAGSVALHDSANQPFTINLTTSGNAFASSLFAGTFASVVGANVNIGAAGSAYIALSGGSGAYIETTTCSVAQVNVGPVTGGYRLIPGSSFPSTCTITPTDGLVSTPQTFTINTYAALTPSALSLNFTAGVGSSYMQTVSISGGLLPFTLSSIPGFVSATFEEFDRTKIDVFPASAGSGSLIVLDALGQSTAVNLTVTTVSIPILSHH